MPAADAPAEPDSEAVVAADPAAAEGVVTAPIDDDIEADPTEGVIEADPAAGVDVDVPEHPPNDGVIPKRRLAGKLS
jgi:hypothetical protein